MDFTTLKLWVKESVEREDFKASHLITVSLHQQGQIEVDNLENRRGKNTHYWECMTLVTASISAS